MITCHLRYVIDVGQLDAFERYGRVWISLVNRLGGVHHGYLMPSEGASNIALASFSFPSLSAYETYRIASFADPECQAAYAFAQKTKCILSYDRTFYRPVTDGLDPSGLQ